jgi:hypothetical protein
MSKAVRPIQAVKESEYGHVFPMQVGVLAAMRIAITSAPQVRQHGVHNKSQRL